jgi:hypothetical protein
MKRIFILGILLWLFNASCVKNSPDPNLRTLLTGHKWYYRVFKQDGLLIPFNYCDDKNYLIFYDGGTGGVGNDDKNCNSTGAVTSPFTYKFIPDSSVIHMYLANGDNITWNVIKLNSATLEVTFTAPTPPPAYAPNFDYTYSAK